MKVVQILKQLNKSELQRAMDFLGSSYFNVKKDTKSLFIAIVSKLDHEDQINNGDLWIEVFENKPYNDLLFRKCVHDLLKNLQNFFVIEQVNSDENAQLNFLAGYCESHNILALKNKLYKKLSSSSTNLTSSNSVFNIYSAKRSLIDLDGVFEQKKGLTNIVNIKSKFEDLNSHIEALYLIEKIRLSLMQNNYSELSGIQFSTDSDQQIKLIPSKLREDYKLLQIYYQVYNLLMYDRTELDIDDFITYLSDSLISSGKETIGLYDSLNNYYARKINAGVNYYQEWFKLLKFGIESKILLRLNELDPAHFRNVVFTACRLNKFDWALDFMDKHKHFLTSKYRQSAYSFNKARVYMNMKRYTEVVDVLRNVEYEDITYNINSRLMLIASFYELDELEVLDSTIKAFKVFLRRKRNISKSRKANFNSHCDVIYNAVRASENKDHKRLLKAQEILNSNPAIPNSSWLQEKIDEVSKKLGIPRQEQTIT